MTARFYLFAMPPNLPFCSRRACASGVPLLGTATEASTWLLIEVPAAWGQKALAESSLPKSVKELLLKWEVQEASRRIQLIRREANTFDTSGRITIFVAHVSANPPELYRFYFEDYTDLLELNLEDQTSDKPLHDGFSRHGKPLFMTCANGRRDACCAKWGREMANAIAEVAGAAAWQTTHLGGHRFAPTHLVLPHGSQYGWLRPEEAASLVESHRKGHLYRIDRYRGHVGFIPPVQAAAAFLRNKVDCRDLDTLAFVEVIKEGSNTWWVRFRLNQNIYKVQVTQEEDATIPLSCGDDPKPTMRFVPKRWQLA